MQRKLGNNENSISILYHYDTSLNCFSHKMCSFPKIYSFVQEREKRLRKKERRKNVAADETVLINEEESVRSIENSMDPPKEAETTDKAMTMAQKNRKPSQFIKQTKAKSIPIPIRNRGKRRMQPWMWVLLIAVALVALFLLGNSNLSLKAGLQGFNF